MLNEQINKMTKSADNAEKAANKKKHSERENIRERAQKMLVAGRANPLGSGGHFKALRKAKANLEIRRKDFDAIKDKGGFHRPGSMQKVC